MDRNSMLFAPAIFALTLSASVYANEPPVKVNVSHLQPSVAREVEKHAAMGMTSLKRYLEATRKQRIAGAMLQMRRARRNFEKAASAIAGRAREPPETLTNSFGETLQRLPITTLALAIGLGLAFGAIWRKTLAPVRRKLSRKPRSASLPA